MASKTKNFPRSQNKSGATAANKSSEFTIAKSTIHQDLISREDKARQRFNERKYDIVRARDPILGEETDRGKHNISIFCLLLNQYQENTLNIICREVRRNEQNEKVMNLKLVLFNSSSLCIYPRCFRGVHSECSLHRPNLLERCK